jgi:hypothetical protein
MAQFYLFAASLNVWVILLILVVAFGMQLMFG